MRGANSDNSRLTGSSDLAGPDWLSISEIIARLGAAGVVVSERQLERWREANLLPLGKQIFDRPGHGGAWLFPLETVDLAVAIRQLQTERNDLAWIRWELWWRGCPAPESCWRPELSKQAEKLDGYLHRLRRILRRERSGDDLRRNTTLADRVAPNFKDPNSAVRFMSSRITRRVSWQDLPTVIRILLDVASGAEPEHEPALQQSRRPADLDLLFNAMDLGNLKRDPATDQEDFVDDTISGHRLQLREAMPKVLQDIASGIRLGRLSVASAAPRAELEAARDDIRRAMEIGQALYQSTQWIYGETAFGLRFINWISRKAPPGILRSWILIWVNMRRADAELYSNEKIRELHFQATALVQMSQSLKALGEQGGELGKVLNPRNLKQVLSGKMSLEEFARLVQLAKLKSSIEVPGAGHAK